MRASRADGSLTRANLLQTLERRELAEVGARMMRVTGLDYAETKPGDRITGTYSRMLTLNSGRFALIECARDFSLVPWRPVLERPGGRPSAASSALGDFMVDWTEARLGHIGSVRHQILLIRY